MSGPSARLLGVVKCRTNNGKSNTIVQRSLNSLSLSNPLRCPPPSMHRPSTPFLHPLDSFFPSFFILFDGCAGDAGAGTNETGVRIGRDAARKCGQKIDHAFLIKKLAFLPFLSPPTSPLASHVVLTDAPSATDPWVVSTPVDGAQNWGNARPLLFVQVPTFLGRRDVVEKKFRL